jgi:hypothetical protein
VAGAVRADGVFVASLFYAAVEADYIVVADATEAAAAVPQVDVGGAYVASCGSGRAVHDDFIDFSHDCRLF